MTKKELRNYIRQQKQKLIPCEREFEEKEIFRQIELIPEFTNARSVLLYYSMSDEVNTHQFIEKWRLEKEIFLPVMEGNSLKISQYCGKYKMRKDPSFGIWEPFDTPTTSLKTVDLVIVPGVAFDSQCNRIGRGKGFYDRLLSSPYSIKIGICYDCQIVPQIPTEKHDKPMDFIISKTKYYSTSSN